MMNYQFPHPKLSFFKSNHRPYYIASGEWLQTSMGYRAPFLLCHILNELGYEAYVTAQKQAPNLRTPLLTREIIKKHKADGREPIAVYNEGMWGNVLQGDVVVRWIMNRLGKLVDELPESSDLFYYWNPIYTKYPQSSSYLQIPAVDTNIFNNNNANNGERAGYAYYAHKYLRDGKGKISDKVKNGGISLCQDIPRTQQEIADILRKVKVLYVYEESAIVVEAAYCGCIVVLVMNDYIYELYGEKTPYDYVIWESELDVCYKWEDSKKLFDIYESECNQTESEIANFIIKTQNVMLPSKQEDEYLDFVNRHHNIYVYGAGITATMVYNVLKVVGANICGFIVSDKFYTDASDTFCGLPVIAFSHFDKDSKCHSGIILAMMKTNALPVIAQLEKKGIDYYNPVLL